jgi:hypothetical protein
VLGGGGALGQPLEHDVVARLRADVDERHAQRAQPRQLGVGLVGDRARGRVAADPAQPREVRAARGEERLPVIHRQDQRVAVGDEHLVDPVAGGAAGAGEVGQRLGQRPHREPRLVAVHVAVGAVVPRAADRRLDDQRVGLGRRTVDLADVAHAAWIAEIAAGRKRRGAVSASRWRGAGRARR